MTDLLIVLTAGVLAGAMAAFGLGLCCSIYQALHGAACITVGQFLKAFTQGCGMGIVFVRVMFHLGWLLAQEKVVEPILAIRIYQRRSL
jgi:hypothetical protein